MDGARQRRRLLERSTEQMRMDTLRAALPSLDPPAAAPMLQPAPPVDPHAIRVLLTGFGPFRNFNENPSWLAIRPSTTPSSTPRHSRPSTMTTTNDPQPIHITCAQIPMTYAGVLATVPSLHARPPILPPNNDPTLLMPPPPENGYDFVLHVALAGRGPLRLERLAHRHGYAMKDAEGEYAPSLPKDGPTPTPEASEIERMEMHLQGVMSSAVPADGHGHSDGPEIPPIRGFGKSYDNFPEEIHSEVDVAKLVHFLKEIEMEEDPEDAMRVRSLNVTPSLNCRLMPLQRVYTSMDAGHYLCDFAYYCSLAEAKRVSSKQEKSKDHRGSPAKSTPVLAMHCPPVNQPLSTRHVTEAIKIVLVRICSQLTQ
ncbi:uncharacterized protein B0H18DRAFT_975735 [Fomitopsis serialis]|uniref:uncharacterized protein n=1 Tax=Fomitopsis serialis TaxID=139415 RepID=UPI0020073ADF|nr:uncharacterized protein B0H18DRAFT_975735 [Neoantrodia serialis]KAH9935447.1 hypothetical protein B0H18DRAFT_975735 [Neoantrodia serialis]